MEVVTMLTALAWVIFVTGYIVGITGLWLCVVDR